MHQEELVAFRIGTDEYEFDWAPWRLIPEIAELMDKAQHTNKDVLYLKRGIVIKNYEESAIPFNGIKISKRMLNKISELHSLYEYDETYLTEFFKNLRDIFFLKFSDKAPEAYWSLSERMTEDRANFKKIPVNELLLYCGLIIWEEYLRESYTTQKTRTHKAKGLLKKQNQTWGDTTKVVTKLENKFGEIYKDLPSPLGAKWSWRFRRIIDELEKDISLALKPYQLRQEYSQVYHLVNYKLFKLLLGRPYLLTKAAASRKIAEYYGIFGIPIIGLPYLDDQVRNHYNDLCKRKKLKNLVTNINTLYSGVSIADLMN